MTIGSIILPLTLIIAGACCFWDTRATGITLAVGGLLILVGVR